jgi:hypothetical protein
MNEWHDQEANSQHDHCRLVDSGGAPANKDAAKNVGSDQHVHSLEHLEGKK